ncbi:MAG: DUF883 domain-containing protein [Methylicorpusculum sp.]|uniref:DUF883 family protein n=1 Tax=Methylicorpusculum sp. TaxID=2713644 RepID=UPI002717ADCE|nr:DUF883 domain-containing protein [Methylicorpusculum sp.]MDO8846701.1 DUF883 domain-containing protein [Methylicorpusculum sp.]MDO8940313.1 DUF883 domain-containing protein [Methylicorpusculum sp.]MDO9240901.1 DUF883 domain-containing protein [Methylicorpusculum sp.]MDP2179193.1 DUF883 domain-containing protein [Methylicorpusculum sp.]MDP2203591.1 DUF883 domain-containing protein [Methylicorpusculum sp.]
MEIIDKAANSADETIDKVAHATNQAAEALGKKGEQLIDAEQQLLEDCRVYVRDNPITSVGIAVAAGFLLSRVLSGR